MFDCGHKSQYTGVQRERFVRLDDLDSKLSIFLIQELIDANLVLTG